MYQQLIDDFIQQERLPSTYGSDAQQCFLPLIRDIIEAMPDVEQRPFLLGINGAQGTGKSTLAKLLSRLLTQAGYGVANLSIDDFYYSKARRQQLAAEVHPLLGTRGVPGTHDVDLALLLMQQLRSAGPSDVTTLPGFDKASDDFLPREACPRIHGVVDVVILEGWFVGATEQREDELEEAINALERSDDEKGDWRRYVNRALGGNYQKLFEQLQMLVMLEAPGFEAVLEWRSLQEEKLRTLAAADASAVMDESAIARFIQYFERLTRHCLNTLPQSADHVFRLDAKHRIHKT